MDQESATFQRRRLPLGLLGETWKVRDEEASGRLTPRNKTEGETGSSICETIRRCPALRLFGQLFGNLSTACLTVSVLAFARL